MSTTNCKYCNKDVKTNYYKRHCETKTHKIKAGIEQDENYEWERKINILSPKMMELFEKRQEISIKISNLKLELQYSQFELIDLDNYNNQLWKIRDTKQSVYAKKTSRIDKKCLICNEKKEHFMRRLLCCKQIICFDCLVQVEKCPFCRFSFEQTIY